MGPPGFEPGTTSAPGWHHSQARLRPQAKSQQKKKTIILKVS